MAVIRSLFFAALSLCTSAAWAQQPTWPLHPMWPLPQVWIVTTPVQSQAIPFPTPFWLWPTFPWAYPLTPNQPPVSITIPTPPSAPIQESAVPPITQPAEKSTNKIATPALDAQPTTPAPSETNIATPVAAIPADKTTATSPHPAIPATSPEAAIGTASAKSVDSTPPRPAAKPKSISKPRVNTKPPQKLRKLCWKDGRLDVCP